VPGEAPVPLLSKIVPDLVDRRHGRRSDTR
jgi:hypothetical protein